MALLSFSVDRYEAYQVALNTQGYEHVYGYIWLRGQTTATLWYYHDSAPTIPSNGSKTSRGLTSYYASFRQAQFHDAIDLLRNEKPVFFQFNDTTNGAFLGTGSEPIGEGEVAP